MGGWTAEPQPPEEPGSQGGEGCPAGATAEPWLWRGWGGAHIVMFIWASWGGGWGDSAAAAGE